MVSDEEIAKMREDLRSRLLNIVELSGKYGMITDDKAMIDFAEEQDALITGGDYESLKKVDETLSALEKTIELRKLELEKAAAESNKPKQKETSKDQRVTNLKSVLRRMQNAGWTYEGNTLTDGTIESLADKCRSAFESNDEATVSELRNKLKLDEGCRYIGENKAELYSRTKSSRIKEEAPKPLSTVIPRTKMQAEIELSNIERFRDDVNRFKAVCDSVSEHTGGVRHTDVRAMAEGFYIMVNGEPRAIRSGESAGDAYVRLIKENPEENVVLTCNIFPTSSYKTAKYDAINKLINVSAKKGTSEKQKEDLYDTITKDIDDTIKMLKPDYLRVNFVKNKHDNKGVLWVEGATYDSTAVPEVNSEGNQKGIKPIDVFRAELFNVPLDVSEKALYGYNVPYSRKTHRYGLKGMCFHDKDTTVCATNHATLIMKKRGEIE